MTLNQLSLIADGCGLALCGLVLAVLALAAIAMCLAVAAGATP